MSSPTPLAYSVPGTRQRGEALAAMQAAIRGVASWRPGRTLLPSRLESLFWLAIIVLGGAQQWASVDDPSSIDLVSYLDIGDAWVQGRWKEAINGYWNPLYSWVLGLVVAVVKPSARLEYPAVEAVDFVIFLFALLAFAWFLRAVRLASRDAALEGGEDRPAVPDWAWVVGGYTLFARAAIDWITLSANTPDMLGAALSLAAWGIALRLNQREITLRYVLLGLALGLAYLSRTPLLIVGAVLLAALALQARTSRRRRGLAVSAAVLLALSLPLVVTVSIARGHLTIGDNGKLNHEWLANPRPQVIPNRYWQGGPEGRGKPEHPVRTLWQEPPAYEFAAPIDGTYPPWTDPSYWYEGLRYKFDAAAELATVDSNTTFYWAVFGKPMLFGFAAVLLLAGDVRRTARALRRNAVYWLPPVGGLLMYLSAADLMVQKIKLQPPQRYIAIFVLLLSIFLALSVRFRRVRWRVPLGHAGAAALVLVSAALFWGLSAEVWTGLRQADPEPPWRIAQALKDAGLAKGTRVATVGRPDYHEFWARLARVRIIADAPDDRAFWAAPPEVREAILDRFAAAGVEVVVSWWMPPGGDSADPPEPVSRLSEPWQRTRGSTYAFRRLRSNGRTGVPPVTRTPAVRR